jgi:quercetin dioxygenase-like cupin family protein
MTHAICRSHEQQLDLSIHTTQFQTRSRKMSTTSNLAKIPADDLQRNLVVANLNNSNAQHLGVVGDTYTILLSGTDTAGRFTLIDMHVPHGGGPPPHRHDFEETFILLDGELEATFRGEKHTVRAGETIHIPANAPHQFHNASSKPVRMLCICSPAGRRSFSKRWEYRLRRAPLRLQSLMLRRNRRAIQAEVTFGYQLAEGYSTLSTTKMLMDPSCFLT